MKRINDELHSLAYNGTELYWEKLRPMQEGDLVDHTALLEVVYNLQEKVKKLEAELAKKVTRESALDGYGKRRSAYTPLKRK